MNKIILKKVNKSLLNNLDYYVVQEQRFLIALKADYFQ